MHYYQGKFFKTTIHLGIEFDPNVVTCAMLVLCLETPNFFGFLHNSSESIRMEGPNRWWPRCHKLLTIRAFCIDPSISKMELRSMTNIKTTSFFQQWFWFRCLICGLEWFDWRHYLSHHSLIENFKQKINPSVTVGSPDIATLKRRYSIFSEKNTSLIQIGILIMA